jgi:uncharacterized protein YndB with AHSA1/START domain
MATHAEHHDSFTVERVYPSPRPEVWAAWSTRDRKAAWLGAAGLELDFRPGGAERSVFHDAMGEHVHEARYFEITEGRRIVLAYSMALGGRVHTVSLATVTFGDEGRGTRLGYTEQMCVLPPSDGATGRERGWQALLDALAGYLEKA